MKGILAGRVSIGMQTPGMFHTHHAPSAWATMGPSSTALTMWTALLPWRLTYVGCGWCNADAAQMT